MKWTEGRPKDPTKGQKYLLRNGSGMLVLVKYDPGNGHEHEYYQMLDGVVHSWVNTDRIVAHILVPV